MTPSAPTAPDLVDLHRYRVDALWSPAGREAVARARGQLSACGVAELPGFVAPSSLELLAADAARLAVRAQRSSGRATAYLDEPDLSAPDGHPRRTAGFYELGVVAYDLIPRSSPLRRLYEWDPLRAFVADVLGKGHLHRYGDPFGALNLAVMEEGDQVQWHFDQTDFVVSLAIESSTGGGDFEVVPRIREENDEHEGRVAAVLGGDRTGLVTLAMTPGTLLIFEGRNSLHRVTPVTGDRARHVGLLAYDTEPERTGSDLLHRSRYGRTRPLPEPPDRWQAL